MLVAMSARVHYRCGPDFTGISYRIRLHKVVGPDGPARAAGRSIGERTGA